MLSREAVSEISTNPYDLEILIKRARVRGRKKFSLIITRGPDHSFKVIIDSQPFAAENLDSVIGVAKTVLDSILRCSKQEIDQTKVLNSDVIAWIIEELRQHQVASTYKMSNSKTE